MCSSAGVVFDILTTAKEVPPFLAAFWRLFIQNTVQLVPFLWSVKNEWRRDGERKMMTFHREELELREADDVNEEEVQEQEQVPLMPRYLRSLPLCCISGIFLGIHFSMWVFSLRYTSLTHSLLWVSMGPIVINGGTWFLYLLGVAGMCTGMNIIVNKPSNMETSGVFLGIMGAIIMLVGIQEIGVSVGVGNGEDSSFDPNNHGQETVTVNPNSNHPPTLYGDAAAFSGAVAVCVYLLIGQKLRTFLPIWLYVFPVIGAASITCFTLAMLDAKDPATLYGYSNKSAFGFLSKDYLIYAVYLGIGPGIFGHTLLNTLLKHVSPLVVTTAMLMEPIFGSIIGYFCGLQPLPDPYTWIGGCVLMVGLVLVVIGEKGNENLNENESQAKEAYRDESCDDVMEQGDTTTKFIQDKGGDEYGHYGSIQKS